jgi:hypothetical protein
MAGWLDGFPPFACPSPFICEFQNSWRNSTGGASIIAFNISFLSCCQKAFVCGSPEGQWVYI